MINKGVYRYNLPTVIPFSYSHNKLVNSFRNIFGSYYHFSVLLWICSTFNTILSLLSAKTHVYKLRTLYLKTRKWDKSKLNSDQQNLHPNLVSKCGDCTVMD
ncbi:hypothetical protein XELAEV_18039754mg [Xenopus laevis]|uniref:Uncharacterized protein n=1 Tax=Xenopus laevis TaxID=8355 RepID=A0A974C8F3_XENLA|nr:hypothetical protein XELAEV_18039754mg [Xenopus laevis]